VKILPLLLYRKIKPHQVFAAGDLQIPMVHEVCLNTILAAMKQLKSQSCMIAGCGCIVLGMSGTSRNRYGSAFKSKRSTIENAILPSVSKDRVIPRE
jgi:hypothetical protein